MKIALIQANLVWHDPEANRNMLDRMIRMSDADLMVLPEMFTTGFSMSPEQFAEDMSGPTIQWMKTLAAELKIAITGSMIVQEHGQYYNRLVFVKPEGTVAHYDKRHLFTLAAEDKVYTAGTDRLIVEFMGFRICPLVCYDLRFPVFSRNDADYDVLMYVANWPEPRINAWDILLRARAVENLCYVVGVNRTGSDPEGNQYIGHSQLVDFKGDVVNPLSENEQVQVCELDLNALHKWRSGFGFLEDRDRFEITN